MRLEHTLQASALSRLWRRMVVLLLLTVTLLGPPGGAEPASAAASATATAATREAAPAELTARAMTRNQRQVLDLINRARRSRGRGSLLTNGLQNRNAQNWAEHLRSIQALIHRRPPFGASVGWCAAAENIGRGRAEKARRRGRKTWYFSFPPIGAG